jgi:hypothetical protein
MGFVGSDGGRLVNKGCHGALSYLFCVMTSMEGGCGTDGGEGSGRGFEFWRYSG